MKGLWRVALRQGACLQVSLRMSKDLPLVVGYRIVDMGEIK